MASHRRVDERIPGFRPPRPTKGGRRSARNATRRLRPRAEILEGRTLLSTVTWINPDGGDWDTPSNWDTGVLPGPTDDVVIDLPGIMVTHSSSASDSINSLTISSSDSALDISDGALALNTSSSIAGSFTLGNAMLSTAGNLTISGTMTWTGGTIAGLGALDIADGAALQVSLDAGNTATLDGVVLENAGAASLSLAAGCCSFSLALEDEAGIDNQATGRFTFPTDFPYATAGQITSDGSGTFFDNEGALIQPAGNIGETFIEPTFTQSDVGSVSVQQGSFVLGGDGSTVSGGTFTGAAGTSLEIDGQILTTDSAISSQGSVALSDCTVEGSYSVAGDTDAVETTFTGAVALGSSLEVDGTVSFAPAAGGPVTLTIGAVTLDPLANLDGTDSFVANGLLTLHGGSILGVPSVDAYGGMAIFATGPQGVQPPLTLDGTTLNNYGAATWDLSGDNGISTALEAGAVINNLAGASLTVVGTSYGGIVAGDGSAVAFNNAGSFTGSVTAVGNDYFDIEVPFSNTGSVDVQQGELDLTDAANSGTVTVASATNLGIDNYIQTAGATVLNGGDILGGDLDINAGVLTGSGTINANVNSGGQVIPGGAGAAGLLSINGNYTQTATGSLNIELGGTTAGTQYDQLDVSGSATVGGSLILGLINGFTPTLGQTFTMVNANPFNGPFSTIDESAIAGPVAFEPTYTSGTVVLGAEESSTTSLTSSANPSAFGQSVTFTATVKPTPPNKGTPTGTVTFYDGSTSLGTATLGGGKATFRTTGLTIGSHAILVVYAGDASFATSSSSSLTQVVSSDTTTVTLSSSANPSVWGQSVNLTATVSVVPPGGGTPTGSITFLDGSTVLATVALSGKTASFKTGALSVGSHPISAVYSGDPNYGTSTSATVTEMVNPDATTTTVTSSKDPSVFGQSVTFTTTVKAASPGGGTPTGTVTILDGSTVLTTVGLSGGKATFSTTALAVATHTITVSYSGDGNFLTSDSAALTQTVNLDATTTKLSSSANPSEFGETVTFTATVSAKSPGSGTPTGTVAFYDGSTMLGGGTLSVVNGADQTTFATSSLVVGSHAITAVYNGDTDFTGSTSPGLTQKVKQATTTATGVSSANPSSVGQPVTFTAMINVVAPGSGTPTGTVSFYAGSTILGMDTLNNGIASFTTSTLAVGTFTIKAVYGGDTSFNPSTSAALRQTVQKATSGSATVSSDLAVDEILGALDDESPSGAMIQDLAIDQVAISNQPIRRGNSVGNR